MAIILPNTRNALGVPSRYSDLAAAGLRYTPPPVYRYDAYDVQGDTATLYASDIDLADYQYNADSDLAQVVPAGYAGVSGGAYGYWLVGLDTRLYYRHAVPNVIELPIGSPTGVTMVTGGSSYCIAIVGGALKSYGYAAGGVTETVIDATKAWTYISKPAGINPGYAIGVADGQLWQVALSPVALTILSYQVGWIAAAPGYSISSAYGGYDYYWSAAIHPSGYICKVRGETGLVLSAPLDLGAGWTAVSGYGHVDNDPATDSRMYGIRAGELNSLSGVVTIATKITGFTDWWKVVFVTPGEAVAIRRTLRA